MADVEVEESAEMTKERILASQHNFVVLFATFKRYHFVVEGDTLFLIVHLITHCEKSCVVHNVYFELGVKRKWVVWVLISANFASSQLRHEFWVVVVYVLICFEQEVIEFL